MKTPAVFAVFLLCVAAAIPQDTAGPQAYDVDAAYEVYSVLLPQEESFKQANGKLVIQQETVPLCRKESEPCGPERAFPPEKCLTDEAAKTFNDAVADFERCKQPAMDFAVAIWDREALPACA